MPRYSEDLLTRYCLTVFDDKKTLDEFWNDPWWQIREKGIKIYYDSRKIEFRYDMMEHSEESLRIYKDDLLSRTWPRNKVIVMDFPMIGKDRLMSNAVKPENDDFEVHKYFASL